MKRELLIFGAAGALGKGVTNTMLNKGYHKVFLFDFNLDFYKHSDNNAELVTIEDLSEEKNVAKAFSVTEPAKDKLLFLFSAIGGFSGGRNIWEAEEEEWNKMFDMNLKSGYLIAKHFASLVKNSAGGSICFTAAATGINPESGKAAYGASKAALIHLVKTLAEEGKKIKLSANAIAPYIIDTPANREWMKDADSRKWIQPEEAGEFINSLFEHFHFISGNVILFPGRFVL
ncbi:MAG: 3-oxoacyl-ACP reductase FabG [Ignavibacteriaceae bacterium]